MYIQKAGYWPYEDHEDDSQDYYQRWEDYENTWYQKEKPSPGDSLNAKELIKAASNQIRAIDFHVRPVSYTHLELFCNCCRSTGPFNTCSIQ